MGGRRKDPLIRSEADLIAQVGYEGPDAIEDWLRDQCDFADFFEDSGDDLYFRRVVFHAGVSVPSHYTIQLAYPFPLTALAEEADRAELHFRGAINASSLDEDEATLGNQGFADDLTADLAEGVLGGANVPDVLA